MEMGGGCADAFPWVLRMQDAALSRQEKSLVLRGAQGGFGSSDVAQKMRRSFRPCVGAARRGVLVAEYAVMPPGSDKDNEARVAYGQAKKRIDMKRKAESAPRMNKEKVKRDGQKMNGPNRRTGVLNRCYKCVSGYHPAPKCRLRDVPGVSHLRVLQKLVKRIDHPIPLSPWKRRRARRALIGRWRVKRQ